MLILNLTYFLSNNFLMKLPFLGKVKVLLKYGYLEVYCLYSEWWNILIRYTIDFYLRQLTAKQTLVIG